jgi:hypothetical protein
VTIFRPEQSQKEHDEHARYIDEINEFEAHTITLTWACYTGCELPISSNTTKVACTTQRSDGVKPLLPLRYWKTSHQRTSKGGTNS